MNLEGQKKASSPPAQSTWNLSLSMCLLSLFLSLSDIEKLEYGTNIYRSMSHIPGNISWHDSQVHELDKWTGRLSR